LGPGPPAAADRSAPRLPAGAVATFINKYEHARTFVAYCDCTYFGLRSFAGGSGEDVRAGKLNLFRGSLRIAAGANDRWCDGARARERERERESKRGGREIFYAQVRFAVVEAKDEASAAGSAKRSLLKEHY
jgi:hypothetical protein